MISKSLMAASTKPLILSILEHGEIYGYQIIQQVVALSGGTLEWSEGMLYPVLHRLEKDNFVMSQWKIAESGRRRKYYRLTEQGRKELDRDKQQWRQINTLLSGLWKPSPSYD